MPAPRRVARRQRVRLRGRVRPHYHHRESPGRTRTTGCSPFRVEIGAHHQTGCHATPRDRCVEPGHHAVDRSDQPRLDQHLLAQHERRRTAERRADAADLSEAALAAALERPEHELGAARCPITRPELPEAERVRPEAVEKYLIINRAATGRLIDMLM